MFIYISHTKPLSKSFFKKSFSNRGFLFNLLRESLHPKSKFCKAFLYFSLFLKSADSQDEDLTSCMIMLEKRRFLVSNTIVLTKEVVLASNKKQISSNLQSKSDLQKTEERV